MALTIRPDILHPRTERAVRISIPSLSSINLNVVGCLPMAKSWVSTTPWCLKVTTIVAFRGCNSCILSLFLPKYMKNSPLFILEEPPSRGPRFPHPKVTQVNGFIRQQWYKRLTGERGNKHTRQLSPQYVVVVAFFSPNQTSNPWKIQHREELLQRLQPLVVGDNFMITRGGRVCLTPNDSEYWFATKRGSNTFWGSFAKQFLMSLRLGVRPGRPEIGAEYVSVIPRLSVLSTGLEKMELSVQGRTATGKLRLIIKKSQGFSRAVGTSWISESKVFVAVERPVDF